MIDGCKRKVGKWWSRLCVSLMVFLCTAGARAMDITVLTTQDGLAQNAVRSIVKDKYGFMWFGTWNGLCRYDGYQMKTYRAIPGDSTSLPYSRIHQLYVDKAGDLWVSTFNYHVCRYEYEKDAFKRFERHELPDGLKKATERRKGYAILKDVPSSVLKQVGSFALSNTKEHLVWKQPSFPVNDVNINALYYDSTGLLWMATASAGVYKVVLNPPRFDIHALDGSSHQALNNPVKAIWVDDDWVWVGTQNEGLKRMNRLSNKWMGFPATKHLSIKGIYGDSQGLLWLACSDGLYTFDAVRQVLNRLEVDAAHRTTERFTVIAEDPSGSTIWVGCFSGLYRFDKKQAQFERIEGLLSQKDNVTGLLFDAKGNLWIGTEYAGVVGLLHLQATGGWKDTLRLSVDHPSLRLPDNRVYAMACDKGGRLWLGTARGLCYYDTKHGCLKSFTEQQGVADLYITKLLLDERGRLWISHKKGLTVMAIETMISHQFFIRQAGYECVEGAGFYEVKTGRAFVGGVDGFLTFMPEKVQVDKTVPAVVLTGLEIMDQSVGVGDTLHGRVVLEQPLYLTRQLVLTQRDKSFSLAFSALAFVNADQLQYAYRLIGYDTAWTVVPASSREVSYSNMPAGTYTFSVKVCNADGLWGPEEALLEVIILRSWWQRPWIYLVFGLILIVVGLLVFRALKTSRQRALHELKDADGKVSERQPAALVFDPLNGASESEDDRAFIKAAVELVVAHLDGSDFGVDELAAALHTSRTPLYRKIKSLTGLTVYEFITTVRLNKAAEMLLDGSMKIAEIADKTGFSTPGNFSRSFARQFGQTPSAYAAGKGRCD